MSIFKVKSVRGLRWSLVFIISFLIVYVSITQLSRASLYGVLNVFTVDFKDHPDDDGLERANNANRLLLEDISQRESELMSNRFKIFFVQTSDNADILPRHACSIESAARLHPTGLIFVLMRSKHVHLREGSFHRLRSYSNLRIVRFREYDVYSGTTLARLNETRRTQLIRYFAISHMSDFVRTALLYKYGGVYFDLDVIPLRTFASLSNTVGLETKDGVNVAVLAMERQHLVLDIQMDIQLVQANQKLNTLCWNCVGPGAFSDALKRVCDQNSLQVHAMDKCHGIDIQPSFVFYPITYHHIPRFFRRSTSSEEVDDLLRNSSIYSIHYFHHMTMNLPVENLSPFARIAQLYCPNVYEQLVDQNESLLKPTQISDGLSSNLQTLLLCLGVSLLCILILLLTGTFLSRLTSIRIIILALQHRVVIPE